MTAHGWLGLLMAGVACTGPPDVVAIRTNDSVGGQVTGGAGGADASTAGEGSDAPALVPLTGALDGHDPAALFDGDQLWIVSGGSAIIVRTTADLVTVQLGTPIFQEMPAWVADEVPEAQGIWSPELARFGGLYHLYYAVSTLGSAHSCIGHATTEALANDSEWLDRGPVICSTASDDFNAIDPSILQTPDGKVWMVFGSYLTGIKLVSLDEAGAAPVSEPVDVAARPDDGGALQAAALARNGDYYYLFVSFHADVSHQLMVGRADAIEGPYVDRSGRALLAGGGERLLEPSARFRGPGSNDVFVIGAQSYNIFHVYDEDDGGRSKLRLATMSWDAEGWPVTAGP